jgi:hypothetical protein
LLFVDGEHVVERTPIGEDLQALAPAAMHALRIAYQGIELLDTGRISLPIPEPHRARLMTVRRGEPTLEAAVEQLDSATAQLSRLVDASDLPDVADATRIDEFLVSAYERAWAREG